MEDGIARWGHPHVSLEEVIEYAAGFLELLVLASGLQSSGHPIEWSAEELRKAFGWATILEKVGVLSFLTLQSIHVQIPNRNFAKSLNLAEVPNTPHFISLPISAKII